MLMFVLCFSVYNEKNKLCQTFVVKGEWSNVNPKRV